MGMTRPAPVPPDDATCRAILDNLAEGVYLVDRTRRITYWNQGAERLTGHSAEDVVGHWCSDGVLEHVDEAGTLLCGEHCPLMHTMRDGRPREAHIFLTHVDGSRRPVCVRAAPLRDDAGAIVGAVETFTDDSELVTTREQVAGLERLALADDLTGVGNRRFAEITLQGWLGQWSRYEWPFGILFVDIDHFKDVNDAHGHTVGDRALTVVARTLDHASRQGDLTARWGGDEFIVLVSQADAPAMRSVAERLRALVRTSRVTAGGARLDLTVSIGGTLVAPGDALDTIVGRADALLYRSKDERDHITLDVA